MARSDWAALLTEPACEYLARTELQRFGLETYLPQYRKRHQTRTGAFVMRHFPLFPRYLLVPIGQAHNPAVHHARGICKQRYVLSDDDGRPWRAPAKAIEAVREAERRGVFDDILHKGDPVTLAYGILSGVRSVMSTDTNTGKVELLMPLLGGAKVFISEKKVVRA